MCETIGFALLQNIALCLKHGRGETERNVYAKHIAATRYTRLSLKLCFHWDEERLSRSFLFIFHISLVGSDVGLETYLSSCRVPPLNARS